MHFICSKGLAQLGRRQSRWGIGSMKRLSLPQCLRLSQARDSAAQGGGCRRLRSFCGQACQQPCRIRCLPCLLLSGRSHRHFCQCGPQQDPHVKAGCQDRQCLLTGHQSADAITTQRMGRHAHLDNHQ